MKNRWNAAAVGALVAAALVLLLSGCSWGFAHDAHGGHSMEHHGDYHHGSDCAVCAGERPPASVNTACPQCGTTTPH